jgi:FlaA1/EpsC-like NDP-sugar epimerase
MSSSEIVADIGRVLVRRTWLRRLAVVGAELASFAGAGALAFVLRFDFAIPARELTYLWWGLAIWIPVKLVAFRLAGLDRGWGRFASVQDAVRIGFANFSASGFSIILIWLLAPQGFPRSIYLLDLLLCLLATAGLRVAIRVAAEAAGGGRQNVAGPRTLVYGAGSAGNLLLSEIRTNPRLLYRVPGFVDDDPARLGQQVQGRPILCTGEGLAAIVRKRGIEQVLIAIPSATGAQMTEILRRCRSAGVKCKTVPGMAEILEDGPLAGMIRDVDVEDLLGRNPVRLEVERIRERLEGKVVLVTGAAGSIGSEICRQVARFGPRGIVAFEIAETALFHLEREMLAAFPGVAFHAEIGNVQNGARVAEVLEAYRPSTVFHAAAYKHVPMMEAHLFEAVENNVFGTRTVAEEAARHGVEEFVMISTDKAVRPTSIMGATKRLAELAVNSLQNGGTGFCSVRFGNVLGSNGSVIPIFKKQIAAGGPVTVTHPEMRRFFMTIPEAVQLVLQAATIGKGGEIFVLDMGEPVKILDLATNLILLSGLRPGEDIQIEFTGMRPGEKLYEEVAAMEEATLPTSHEKIKVFGGASASPALMRARLVELQEICSSRDVRGLVLLFKELVPEYNPSVQILGQAFNRVREAVVQ